MLLKVIFMKNNIMLIMLNGCRSHNKVFNHLCFAFKQKGFFLKTLKYKLKKYMPLKWITVMLKRPKRSKKKLIGAI